ncbi:MAG TPA: lysophospholipid acyltransferase family protein [Chitinophagaceae bacterium]|nr:lysophospholipid acyltransferase family protein [Chitinophagaceae bacterium]
MRFLQQIIARFFALWAMITFIITFLLFFIPSMLCWLIPDPKGQKIFIGLSRIWMSIWLPLTGCRVRIKGWHHFEKGQTYIVTSNHNSLMDVPLTSPFIPGANKTIAKKSFAKIPLFGFYYRKGSVLVDRKDEKSRIHSFDEMKAVLKKNIHICIYPEGTRNRTTEPLKKFYDGAFRLAISTQKDIIPAVIFNTKKILPMNKSFYFWPHKIEMHFLPPVSFRDKTVHQLRDEVFTTMKNYYVENKRH